MPKRLPLAQTVIVSVRWENGVGNTATNVFHVLTSQQLTTPTQFQQVATNMNTALGGTSGGFHPMIAPPWFVNEVVATDNSGLSEISMAVPGTLTAGYSGQVMSPQVASGISWEIPAHYRGGHPRTYLPGTPVQAMSSNGGSGLAATFRSALASAASSFLTTFNSALIGAIAEQLGSMAFSREGVELSPPVFYPYSGGSIHGRIDSQRRRNGKEANYP